jgi:hypothetical protein
VCGLCGNNNGEEWDDMRLPNGQIAGNVEDLLRGYTVRKDGCNAESNLLQSATQTQFGRDRQQGEKRFLIFRTAEKSFFQTIFLIFFGFLIVNLI